MKSCFHRKINDQFEMNIASLVAILCYFHYKPIPSRPMRLVAYEFSFTTNSCSYMLHAIKSVNAKIRCCIFDLSFFLSNFQFPFSFYFTTCNSSIYNKQTATVSYYRLTRPQYKMRNALIRIQNCIHSISFSIFFNRNWKWIGHIHAVPDLMKLYTLHKCILQIEIH